MSERYKIGDSLPARVEKIVPGGYGLAFAENLTIFVALAAPGDELRVKINRIKGKTAFAEIEEILNPSENRAQPECPYFGACGGCDFQQMNYAAQLEAKVAIIRDCLKRIGKIDFSDEIPIIGSPKDYRYRARAQWHIDTSEKKLGYFRRHSHSIIDVEICPILVPELQETLTRFRAELSWEQFWAETAEIEAAASGKAVSVYSPDLGTSEEISFEILGNRYFYDAETFFQGNPFLIEDLIRVAVNRAEGETAIDLYCGVGLFALPLARKFKTVFGVEANEKAVAFARKNSGNAQAANIEFSNTNVSEFLTENRDGLKDVDFILLDPPRAGAENAVIENLLQIRPKQISYVSCDPATLARDLRVLTENFYAIESITALDLFPQTHHIETIVRLKTK